MVSCIAGYIAFVVPEYWSTKFNPDLQTLPSVVNLTNT